MKNFKKIILLVTSIILFSTFFLDWVDTFSGLDLAKKLPQLGALLSRIKPDAKLYIFLLKAGNILYALPIFSLLGAVLLLTKSSIQKFVLLISYLLHFIVFIAIAIGVNSSEFAEILAMLNVLKNTVYLGIGASIIGLFSVVQIRVK